MKRVVITGLGAITPIGNNINEFWESIVEGKSGAAPLTKFDTSKFKTQFGCEVKDFHPEEFLDRKELRSYDLFTQYAIAASDQAIQDSGLNLKIMSEAERSEIGVIWASGNGGIGTFEKELKEYHTGDGTPRFSPFLIPKMIVDIAAGVISIRNGLLGPNYATVSACASSNTAIINAFDTIRLGKASVVICGGSEAAITESSVGGFNASQALSKRNDDPQGASRPFDETREGFVIGEGAGALVLEELEHALARNATIYAEMVGGGMAADAYHLTGTHPDGLGAMLSMNKALKEAGINASQIDYVNAHATSTSMGDISELKGIKRVFDNNIIKVTGTKSMTGHLLGAAGAIESIISILSVRDNIMPATINTLHPDKEIPEGIDLVLHHSRYEPVNYVLNNTFGFGGHTASSIFKKYQ
ncbi:beta-ketoacyl-ACP synthase II [Microbacter margulisiae]|uniref:3-oxoacyl-[acyl-carrier-protein] synthase 2 n=1 Tax=Microbacter margulisiae TaxID=1350067 RepID=A0A7W5DPX2_9PORP|nr:beta-ketoacyl-ACP synthase II [Microbacter margulisiae]MBB3186133.1 3-oxoacyl-[acyl-carrier-protein] synthase II [Microbacter margulisiae]